MVNARNKGAAGERELAKVLRELGFDGARRGQQFSGGTDSPDVIAIDGIHIECKRVEKLNLEQAMSQSIRDAGEKLPTVMHRKNRGEWLVTAPLKEVVKFAELILKGLK